MKRIYIASPYTIGDTALNVRRQIEVANALMEMGFCPIVPLFTHFQHMIFPRPYEDWLAIDLCKIEGCHALLRLEGESKGADMEVDHARNRGIPVVYDLNELIMNFEMEGSEWDSDVPDDEYFKELKRVSKHQII